jgi:hypothetical protein
MAVCGLLLHHNTVAAFHPGHILVAKMTTDCRAYPGADIFQSWIKDISTWFKAKNGPWLPKPTLTGTDLMRVDTFHEAIHENNDILKKVLVGFNTAIHDMGQISNKIDHLCTRVEQVEQSLTRIEKSIEPVDCSHMEPVVTGESTPLSYALPITPERFISRAVHVTHLCDVLHKCSWFESNKFKGISLCTVMQDWYWYDMHLLIDLTTAQKNALRTVHDVIPKVTSFYTSPNKKKTFDITVQPATSMPARSVVEPRHAWRCRMQEFVDIACQNFLSWYRVQVDDERKVVDMEVEEEEQSP